MNHSTRTNEITKFTKKSIFKNIEQDKDAHTKRKKEKSHE